MNAQTLTHEWAHQLRPRGKASALSYEGPALFSYSTVIGRILAPGVYLLNDAHFSPTTSKHASFARRAIPDYSTILRFADNRLGTRLQPEGLEVIHYCMQMAAAYERKAARARTNKEFHHETAAKWLKCATDAANHYDYTLPTDIPAWIEKLNVEVALSEQERRERERAMEAKREADAAEKLAQWLAGEPVHVPYLTHARFRIDPEDAEQVQSTQGVTVPRVDVARAIRFALARRGKGWQANGETCPVGPYALSSINGSGVVAGCHRVTWAEVERLAGVLGA